MNCKDFKALPRALTTLDPVAARRAICVDYEGNKFAPPTLLGWRVEGTYGAAIVEPAFATCARRHRARDPLAVDHAVAAVDLIQRAIAEQRHIVSWSLHDPKLLCSVVDRHHQEMLRSCFVNAIQLARPWHHRVFGCTPPSRARQVYFACLFDIRIPQAYGDRIVATHLSALRPLVKSGLQYRDLTTDQRKRWVAVVKHNQWDLRVMEDIVKRLQADRPPSPGRTLASCSATGLAVEEGPAAG